MAILHLIDGKSVWKHNIILSFDFKHESFKQIGAPDESHTGEGSGVICRWKGNLSLLCWTKRGLPHRCDFYSQQDGNSWVRIYSFHVFVPIDVVFCALEESDQDSVEVLSEKGKVLARVETELGPMELGLYEAKTGYIPLKMERFNTSFANMAFDFLESMLFPD